MLVNFHCPQNLKKWLDEQPQSIKNLLIEAIEDLIVKRKKQQELLKKSNL